MIWLVLLVVLVVSFLAVMFWQPGKAKSLMASMPTFPHLAPTPQTSERTKSYLKISKSFPKPSKPPKSNLGKRPRWTV